MAWEETTLEVLLAENTALSHCFAVEAVEGSPEMVTLTPINAAGQLMCGASVEIPKSAVKGVRKTGHMVQCCGGARSAVEIEFSDDKALTYKDLIAAVRDNHQVVTDAVKAALRSMPISTSISGGQSGGVAANPMSYGSCMDEAAAHAAAVGLRGRRLATWMGTWAHICGAMN